MKIKLSPWSIVLILIIIVLVLNLFNVIKVDAWGIFGIVVSVACAWAIYYIFLRKRD
jgi:presenilin-like A22 family membrane protease